MVRHTDNLSGKICAMHGNAQRSGNGVMTDVLIVLCTCPDPSAAEKLAAGLVDNGFAACVNIFPGIRSIYRWQDELQVDDEVLLLVKTSRDAYPQLERWLLDNHPYDVPEVLALPVETGAADYLAWVGGETSGR
jgi:periplasmic divalent cation tolerance protein